MTFRAARNVTRGRRWVCICVLATATALLIAAGTSSAAPVGSQVRVSEMGPNGNENFGAYAPAAAYNPQANQFLVIWAGDETTDGEQEIHGRHLDGGGAPLGDEFRISDMGPDGSVLYSADWSGVAYNPQANEYLVAWTGNDSSPSEYEIYGQRLSASGAELGTNDFRISDMGPEGNAAFTASRPDVTYNFQANEYLVAWEGTDNTAPLVANEYEIFGQRLDAGGAELGTNDFRISDMGPDGSTLYAAELPALTYSPQANEYLVAWRGDDNTAPLVNDEREIFGQRLDAGGAELGTNDFRISDLGPDGSFSYFANSPAVTHNPQANEYLVAWSGDDNTAPLVDNENEIFGQRLDASGAELGTNDFRISDMGPDGNTSFSAAFPGVAYNPQANEYLVAWTGDDDTAPLVNDESEVYGQRLDAGGAEAGANDFRVSQMGPDGDASFSGGFLAGPAIASNQQTGEDLVAWEGDDNTAPLVDNEYEIFARRSSGGEPPSPVTSLPVGGPSAPESAPCSPSLLSALTSVSHWRVTRGLRVRLKGPAGGYVPGVGARASFAIETRQAGGRFRPRAVEFALDGRRQMRDRHAPYAFLLGAGALERGFHTVTATIQRRHGRALTVRLPFLVSPCEGAAFSAGMSPKHPGAHPDLSLRARTGGEGIEAVAFTLPSGLRWAVGSKSSARTIGKLAWVGSDGSSHAAGLALPRRRAGSRRTPLVLLERSGLGTVVADLGRSAKTISVTGLAPGTTAIELTVRGRSTKLLRTAARCGRRYRFGAQVTLAGGKRVPLTRSLLACKG